MAMLKVKGKVPLMVTCQRHGFPSPQGTMSSTGAMIRTIWLPPHAEYVGNGYVLRIHCLPTMGRLIVYCGVGPRSYEAGPILGRSLVGPVLGSNQHLHSLMLNTVPQGHWTGFDVVVSSSILRCHSPADFSHCFVTHEARRAKVYQLHIKKPDWILNFDQLSSSPLREMAFKECRISLCVLPGHRLLASLETVAAASATRRGGQICWPLSIFYFLCHS